MTIAFPDIGAPARLRWRIISNTQFSQSPLSGSVQTYGLPGTKWGFTAEWPPLDGESRRLMRAFLAELGGHEGRFTVRNWEQPEIAGSGLAGKYGILPGVTGNYFSTPDSAALDITGDIDIRVKAKSDDWTPVNNPYFSAKGGFTTAGGYYMRLLTSGVLVLGWSNGATAVAVSSTSATGFSDGSTHWVRAVLDVDRGGSPTEYQVIFYTSEDGETWTQLGSVVNGAGPAAIAANTTDLAVGMFSNGTSDPFSGEIHYAEIRNGIDGTVVAEFDPSDWTSGTTWTSDTGEIWTVNSSGSPSSGISAIAAPTVQGASQTGNSLTTEGWKPNATGVLLRGDYFGVNGELKQVVSADVDADNYGNATISFRPPLRSSPANGAALDLTNPETEFMLTGPVSEWSVGEGNLFADFSIDAVEVF